MTSADQPLAVDTFPAFGTTAVLIVTEPASLAAARVIADAELATVDAACYQRDPAGGR